MYNFFCFLLVEVSPTVSYILFFILFNLCFQTPVTGEEVAEFSLGYTDQQENLKYKIYVTTFLGYGANKVYDKYLIMK
jgi:hypothetical protein